MTELIKTLYNDFDIATVILFLILFLGGCILWTIQQKGNNNFNFEEMLRDEEGKPSSFRLAVFVSLAVSTWIIMYIVLKTNTLDTWMFVTYLGIWSGAKIAETALIAYSQSKGGGQNSGPSIESRGEQEYDRQQSQRRYEPPRRYDNDR